MKKTILLLATLMIMSCSSNSDKSTLGVDTIQSGTYSLDTTKIDSSLVLKDTIVK